MEKKNMVLLTVIAVATLLVAVVGATFAYFTAQTTETNKNNNQIQVTTKQLASVTFDYGTDLADALTDKYPGFMAVKTLSLSNSSTDSALNGNIVVTGVVPASFANDVTIKVYKSEPSGTDNYTYTYTDGEVTSTEQTTGNVTVLTVYDTDTFTPGASDTAIAISGATAQANGGYALTNGAKLSFPVSVPATSNAQTPSTNYYYVVLEYVNHTDAEQNVQQGQSFSATISFEQTL